MSIKVFSFHVFTHSEENHFKDCEICEYVISSNEVSFSTNEFLKVEFLDYEFGIKIFCNYRFLLEHKEINNFLSCRPPPIV